MAEREDIAWEIEGLSPEHDRSAFCCGEPSLDDFLKRLATQYTERGLARTYVATLPPDRQVRGYYSLAAGSVSVDILPEKVRKKLPRHPVPVALLGRLAVAKDSQGKGLGGILLVDALKRCSQTAEKLGIQAVEVHAISEAAKEFYEYHGFTALEDDPCHLYLSMKAVKRLRL